MEKNQKYLNEKREQMIQEFKELQNSNAKITKTVNKISKELEKRFKLYSKLLRKRNKQSIT